MENFEALMPEAPSLPKSSGALTGLNGRTRAAGPDGTATLPLPISAGRGYLPQLALTYSSQDGNGIFGMGWSTGIPAISRRTRHGAPSYTMQDEFLGPDGEVLVPALNNQGEPEGSNRNSLLGITLPGPHPAPVPPGLDVPPSGDPCRQGIW